MEAGAAKLRCYFASRRQYFSPQLSHLLLRLISPWIGSAGRPPFSAACFICQEDYGRFRAAIHSRVFEHTPRRSLQLIPGPEL